jgi:hypothetical protein
MGYGGKGTERRVCGARVGAWMGATDVQTNAGESMRTHKQGASIKDLHARAWSGEKQEERAGGGADKGMERSVARALARHAAGAQHHHHHHHNYNRAHRFSSS